MDAVALTDERRQTRTAKSCGPGAPMQAPSPCRMMCGRRWQTLVHRGEPEVSRKPLRGEGRLSPPVPVVNARSAQLFLRGGPGCMRPPGLPCALCYSEGDYRQSSGEARREDDESRRQSFRGPCFETPLSPSSGRVSRGPAARLLGMGLSCAGPMPVPHDEEALQAPSPPMAPLANRRLACQQPLSPSLQNALWCKPMLSIGNSVL